MPLRTKTRSRKERDLKRLDGIGSRRRRRTVRRRRQRGGAVVSSIQDWVKQVSESAGYKQRTDPAQEDYRIGDVLAQVGELTLPPMGTDNESFVLKAGAAETDARIAASAVGVILSEILKANPTIGQFKAEMEQQISLGKIGEDGEESGLDFLVRVENALRGLLPSSNNVEPSSEQGAAIEASILVDENKYPLYIWAFASAVPASDEASTAPILSAPQPPTPASPEESAP